MPPDEQDIPQDEALRVLTEILEGIEEMEWDTDTFH